jgi:hypothetical protein
VSSDSRRLTGAYAIGAPSCPRALGRRHWFGNSGPPQRNHQAGNQGQKQGPIESKVECGSRPDPQGDREQPHQDAQDSDGLGRGKPPGDSIVIFLSMVSIHFGLLIGGYGHRAAGTTESVIAAVLVAGLLLTLQEQETTDPPDGAGLLPIRRLWNPAWD